MAGDVYGKLREFMDTLQGGFPATPTGVEIKILKKLFSPQEAELVMQLKTEPEEVPAIAARAGLTAAEAGEMLEGMARKGLIFRIRREGRPLYQAVHFVVGVYEFQLNHLDKEFCQMFEEYLPHLGMSFMSVKTKQMRVIPVDSSLTPKTKVETYNRVRELVKQQKVFALAKCICRKEQGILGKECSRPKETCLGFGDFAQFYIENGMGRQITREEALQNLDRAEASGLVLCPTNSQEPAGICCCCPCCCPTLKYAKLMPRPVDLVQSYYRARIDPELCSACGQCIERCQIGAIKEGENSSRVLEERCIGCGLCVSSCPTEALTLVMKEKMEPPPRTFVTDTLRKIEAERRALKSK